LLTMSLPANQETQAIAEPSPVSELVGLSPLVQFKSSLLRRLCFAATINEDCYQLGTFNCLSGHAPTTTIRTASSRQKPSYQLIRTGSGQKSSSPSLRRIRLSQGTVSPDNGITIYSYAWRKSKPTSFPKIAGHAHLVGSTAEPQAKSKQTPTLIAPQLQTPRPAPFH
jgi:hypothetical protein